MFKREINCNAKTICSNLLMCIQIREAEDYELNGVTKKEEVTSLCGLLVSSLYLCSLYSVFCSLYSVLCRWLLLEKKLSAYGKSI